jgi:hypothetical protein
MMRAFGETLARRARERHERTVDLPVAEPTCL